MTCFKPFWLTTIISEVIYVSTFISLVEFTHIYTHIHIHFIYTASSHMSQDFQFTRKPPCFTSCQEELKKAYMVNAFFLTLSIYMSAAFQK